MSNQDSISSAMPHSLPLSQRWLTIKSLFLSFYYFVWLSTNNFQKIKSLHNLVSEDVEFEYTIEQKQKIAQISKAINKVKKIAPWKPKCYNQALIARRLLKENEIPNLLKIGFRKRDNQIKGHAWVHCNKIVVSGYLQDLNTFNFLKPIKD